MSNARVKRPTPSRTAPHRSAAASFRSSVSESVPQAQNVAQVIDSAVQTAYRVIDEYLQQGWQTAGRYYGPLGASPMGEGFPGGQDMANPPQQMMTTMMRFWTEMAQAWLGPYAQMGRNTGSDSAWDRGAAGSPAAPRTAPASPEASARVPSDASSDASTGALAVSVELSSQQPAEVTIHVQPGTDIAALSAQDLRAFDGDGKPALSAVRCEAVDGRLRVEVTVPRDQPVGVYSGALVDRARGEARGTVTVALRPMP
jgi:hypothetical protein